MTETMSTEWFTRSGQQYTGPVSNINESRGTAEYSYQAKCSRCGGAGGSETWRFTGWTCYQCGGSGDGGIKTVKVYTAEKLAKLDAAQTKRDAKRAEKNRLEQQRRDAEAQAARARFEQDHSEFVAKFRAWHTANQEAYGFLADVWDKFQQYGSLSEKQMAAVSQAIDRELERQRARESSQHIGELGKRLELELTVEKHLQFPVEHGAYYYSRGSTMHIYLCRDMNGNRVVYKGGGAFPSEGETGKVKATVKEHGERNGEKQTIISRPKWLDNPYEKAQDFVSPSNQEVTNG